MSNNRALRKFEDYQKEIARCDYAIKKTKSYKCKRDFLKHRERLVAELREYLYWKNR